MLLKGTVFGCFSKVRWLGASQRYGGWVLLKGTVFGCFSKVRCLGTSGFEGELPSGAIAIITPSLHTLTPYVYIQHWMHACTKSYIML